MAEVIKEFSEDNLLYVTSEDGSSKGWRVHLLVEELSSKVEEKVLLCSCCNGLLRDACLCNGALMCQVCIPEDTVVQPVVMNREIVNEKMVSCLLLHLVDCYWLKLYISSLMLLIMKFKCASLNKKLSPLTPIFLN